MHARADAGRTVTESTPDSKQGLGQVLSKRRRRGRQKRDRLDTYITHMRNRHVKGLTVAHRKEEANRIANSRANLQDSSRDRFIYELNIVADPALGPFCDRLFEIASDLLEVETELCDLADRPASERPRLQIIFVNRLCERALKMPGGVSAAIADFVRELSTARVQLEGARKGQLALPI
jgi:hypothetical protein